MPFVFMLCKLMQSNGDSNGMEGLGAVREERKEEEKMNPSTISVLYQCGMTSRSELYSYFSSGSAQAHEVDSAVKVVVSWAANCNVTRSFKKYYKTGHPLIPPQG